VNLADDLVLRTSAEEQRLRFETSEALAQEKVLAGEVAFADERRLALEALVRDGEVATAGEDGGRARLAEEQFRLEQIVQIDDVHAGGEAAAAHVAHAESNLLGARTGYTEAEGRRADLEASGAAIRSESEQRAARLAALQGEREQRQMT
jgi:hypothetical protein